MEKSGLKSRGHIMNVFSIYCMGDILLDTGDINKGIAKV